MKERHGNGSSKVVIHQTDMGGWVRFWPDSPKCHADPQLPLYLSQTLANWFRQRPNLRLRFAIPITHDGFTTEIHAWFDVHVFPPLAGPEAEEIKRKKQ